jgi:hypothetical protein
MSESNEVIKCGGPTQNWYAWLNTMPPKPDDFHVTGEVQVANPGVDAILRKREPQGVNPAILLLDQHLVQRPGMWPQVISQAQARYDEVIIGDAYTQVQIFAEGQIIADLTVDIVS